MWAPVALLLAFQLSPPAGEAEYRQPRIVVSNSGVSQDNISMTFGSHGAVYFSASSDGGASFSQPVEVARASKLALGRRRGPRIAKTGDSVVISALVGDKKRGWDGDLVAWNSNDGGQTWSKGVVINDAPKAAREGLHDMAAGDNGLVYAAWLDLRNKKTYLYGARSLDGGATWSKNVLIYQSPDGTICQCCHPTVKIDGNGAVHVMWRNALGGARDMYWLRSADGGKTFSAAQKLGKGTWMLEACPMDGGGLTVASDGAVSTIWRRKKTLFLAQPGQAETMLGPGKNAAIFTSGKGTYAVWSRGQSLMATAPNRKTPFVLAEQGGYVDLAGTEQVYAAWENGGEIFVEAVR